MWHLDEAEQPQQSQQWSHTEQTWNNNQCNSKHFSALIRSLRKWSFLRWTWPSCHSRTAALWRAPCVICMWRQRRDLVWIFHSLQRGPILDHLTSCLNRLFSQLHKLYQEMFRFLSSGVVKWCLTLRPTPHVAAWVRCSWFSRLSVWCVAPKRKVLEWWVSNGS